MRKAALISGSLCLLLVTIGIAFRLFHIPGHSLFIVLATGFFAGITLPLYYFSVRAEGISRKRKIAAMVGLLFGMQVIVMLLFVAQRWEGWFAMLMHAVVLGLFYIILPLDLKTLSSERVFRFSSFHGIYLGMVAVLLAVPILRKDNTAESEQLVATLQYEDHRYDSITTLLDAVYLTAYDDTLNTDSVRDLIRSFFFEAKSTINDITEIEGDFVWSINYGESAWKNLKSDYREPLSTPMDKQFTRIYFIGENVQVPSGRALDLFELIEIYRNHTLHPSVPFVIQVNATGEHRVQWVKDNFYETTAVEARIRICLLRQNILQSIRYTLEHKLYKELT